MLMLTVVVAVVMSMALVIFKCSGGGTDWW